MLASLISYESERRLYKKAYHGAVYSDDVKRLLRDDNKTKGESILNTVSTYLSGLYDPKATYGMSLAEIRKSIKEIIEKNSLVWRQNGQTESVQWTSCC